MTQKGPVPQRVTTQTPACIVALLGRTMSTILRNEPRRQTFESVTRLMMYYEIGSSYRALFDDE